MDDENIGDDCRGRLGEDEGGGGGRIQHREFIGCTPERLFKVNRSGQHDRIVTSEALAGTRIRGLTPSADNQLLRDLLSSKKDMLENEITGDFIRGALNELEENGWLEKQTTGMNDDDDSSSDEDVIVAKKKSRTSSKKSNDILCS